MTNLVFFYGTLMSGFRREGRVPLEQELKLVGSGWIAAALFDLGIYPAAVPAEDSQVRGELYQMLEPSRVLKALDEIEGHRAAEPDASLYLRVQRPVTLDDGRVARAWVYFYNAPLGRAERIESGDYREHLLAR